ncbi:uncharacterized protein LOC134243375 [Saccostrea cucullata]|uniref:uncharacterized protein LOC134243375 n=1 Tax=Saccostrea cuccullata TaxID=36930 RepID=UPI002ED49DBF
MLRHVLLAKDSCKLSTRRCHYCPQSLNLDTLKSAEIHILREVQRSEFSEEVECLIKEKPIPKGSSIISLAPFLDSNGLLRVGGRISALQKLVDLDVYPIIIPKKSHIATLLTRYFHEKVSHQGRKMTEGKIRSSGFWIIGVKRLIASEIHHCVTCRKLRGAFCGQKKANLPKDRLTPRPPFTFVGLNTFGPWDVTARRTRGGLATSKRWAIMFTCLISRGIHIELVEELSTSSFINALRRFLSIRGPVRQFRSDRGTKFIGAVKELQMVHQFVEKPMVQRFLQDNECSWIFNPPHASHFGGAWERMIGVTRRILDGMLLRNGMKGLTHDTLSTFLAEVCAIVNSLPLTTITEDASDPSFLTPAMILTQKIGHLPESLPDIDPKELYKYPSFLTPAMILTQKIGHLPESLPDIDPKELYKSQRHYVQTLAAEFWRKWECEYLSALQTRRKRTLEEPSLKEGDVVMLEESESPRNQWSVARVNRIFPSTDGHVREVEVRVVRGGHCISLC